MRERIKLKLIGKTAWHGIVGIFFEIILILFFIISAYLVCLLWWKIIK